MVQRDEKSLVRVGALVRLKVKGTGLPAEQVIHGLLDLDAYERLKMLLREAGLADQDLTEATL